MRLIEIDMVVGSCDVQTAVTRLLKERAHAEKTQGCETWVGAYLGALCDVVAMMPPKDAGFLRGPLTIVRYSGKSYRGDHIRQVRVRRNG
jgi:hypothetical protein